MKSTRDINQLNLDVSHEDHRWISPSPAHKHIPVTGRYLEAGEPDADAAKWDFQSGPIKPLLERGKITDPLITTITIFPKEK